MGYFPQISPLKPHTRHSPTHLVFSWYYHRNNILSGVLSMKLFIMPSPITSSLWGPNIFHSTLSSDTLSPYSSLNMRQFFHTNIKGYSYISVYLHFWIGNKASILWTEWQQEIPEFNLLLINWWMQFWFVTVLPKYAEDCSILSVDLLPLFTSWFCPAFYSQNFNVCLFSTASNFFW